MQFVFGRTWIFISSFNEHLVPEHHLVFLLWPKFLVNILGDGLRVYVSIGFDAVGHNLILLFAQQLVRGCYCFVHNKGSFHLVLALFVTGWSSFNSNVPSMVVNVSSVDTCICCLRVWSGMSFIHKAFSNQEFLMCLRDASNVIKAIRLRHTGVPSFFLSAE
jgi:hypothetical protein